jgi:hypothetical protein
MNNEEIESKELLLRRAAFGKQVEQFMNTDIGKYLMHRATEEVIEAFAEFKKCDAREGKAIEKVQNKIYRAESFKSWLTDAVLDGVAAYNILEDREE